MIKKFSEKKRKENQRLLNKHLFQMIKGQYCNKITQSFNAISASTEIIPVEDIVNTKENNEEGGKNMKVLRKLPQNIMDAIKNDTLTNEQLAQLLVEGSVSNHLEKNFHSISPIYQFTTEPISQYLRNVDLTGKDVLTVAGSGDHLLSAVNKGASFISTFDISLLTEYYQELKIVALMRLNYKDFLEFFASLKSFDNDIYDEIKGGLSYRTRRFWDSLFNYYDGYDISHSQLFMNQIDTTEKATSYNPYLKNEDEYNKTKENMKKTYFNFYNLDVLALPTTLVRRFDVVLLSNIPDYVEEMGIEPDELACFFREKMTSLLKDAGAIIATRFDHEINEKKGPDWELEKANEIISTLTFHK